MTLLERLRLEVAKSYEASRSTSKSAKPTALYPIEALQDFKPSLCICLFPNGFCFENQMSVCHPYDRSLASFINAIDAGKMSPDLMELFEDIPCNYYDGCLLVELRDYRHQASTQLMPAIRRVLLHPDAESITNDIEQICQESADSSVIPDPIVLEQKIMVTSLTYTHTHSLYCNVLSLRLSAVLT